jgi:outer membrane receptor for ferric coprogen and ferric-rhodotorulic acid
MKHSTAALAAGLALAVASASAQTSAPPRPDPTADETVTLSVFTVSEEQDRGYESMQTTSGLRTVQELRNVANSISVMNAQLIEDLAVLDIQEMSKWFVTGEVSPDPTQPFQLVFRGVRNSFGIRNGWIWYSPIDAYSTERVELLRGPTAFLYGEADIGGANNQVTKRGLFTRDLVRGRLMVGSNDLRRTELDLNRILVRNQLALRVSSVYSKNGSWIDHVRREFRAVYGALTYRPFRSTTISVMGEYAKSTSVNSQGLFLDAYTRATPSTVAASGGYIYVPATGALFRAQGRVISTGSGSTVVDPAIVPRTWQTNGPNATANNNYQSIAVDVEQRLGKNLHLLLSGNYYLNDQDAWGASARNIVRDRSPNLPNGTPNPYYNELYTEYFRTRNVNGNIVRDVRLSAVYDLNLKWTRQQFIVNLQQHQDNPGQKYPKFGEYLDPKNPAFAGTINPAGTQAAFTANRTVFTNNRFMRRYYLKDGNGGRLTGDLGPVPGVSAWYPDMSNLVPATGSFINRRFYTPSFGFGASGSYFNNHFFTLAGYRRDRINMKTTVGVPRILENTWIVDEIPGAFAPNPTFMHQKADGANAGAVLRFNDAFAVAYNYAQSFRISLPEGADLFTVGKKQAMQTGEGQDLSARFRLFGGRLEFNATCFHNFQPNGRIAPAPVVAIRDEVSAIFPTTFYPTGQDYQKITTKGLEFEAVANLTRNWRLMTNLATNKVVTEDRLPLLKGFQAEARKLGRPTPLLDAFLLTFPDGVPNAGYTKVRANLFTRYEFSRGWLKGLSLGGGGNWRERTFRGNADVNNDGTAEQLWSPSYYTLSLSAGYRTKVFNRPTSFALNVDNLLDKEYYLSATTTSGSWGAPRSFRLTMFVDF